MGSSQHGHSVTRKTGKTAHGAVRGGRHFRIGEEIKRQVNVCLDELRRDALREESLRRIAELADGLAGGRQDLLYLQAEQTSVTSRVIGMSMFVGGEFSDGPEDPDDWPYQTVGEALADGWRIVKFPEMAILLDDRRTYGLGCEFILEQWGGAT